MENVQRTIETARLYLNGTHVGDIHVRGWETSWGFGQFRPNEAFETFAVHFGRWSLLMHSADGERDVSAEALDELRQIEYAIDALRAKLFLIKTGEWREIGQINIDGELVEWKEKWAG